jgi:Co/Zn/Cd efflux system component
MTTEADDAGIRNTVRTVAGLNLGYFGIEFAVALAIGSVALFADSVDFLEDASVNILIFIGIGWSVARRARLGMALAALLLVPSLATLLTAWQNFSTGLVPAALPMTLAGLGALAINFTCATLLARYRNDGGSLTRAAFLSARNDVVANIAIIMTGFVTAATASPWPDLVTGLGIAAMNADAAREVYEAARAESAAAKP